MTYGKEDPHDQMILTALSLFGATLFVSGRASTKTKKESELVQEVAREIARQMLRALLTREPTDEDVADVTEYPEASL